MPSSTKPPEREPSQTLQQGAANSPEEVYGIDAWVLMTRWLGAELAAAREPMSVDRSKVTIHRIKVKR